MKILTQLDIDKWMNLVGQSTVTSFFQTPSCYNFYKSMSFLEPFLGEGVRDAYFKRTGENLNISKILKN